MTKIRSVWMPKTPVSKEYTGTELCTILLEKQAGWFSTEDGGIEYRYACVTLYQRPGMTFHDVVPGTVGEGYWMSRDHNKVTLSDLKPEMQTAIKEAVEKYDRMP